MLTRQPGSNTLTVKDFWSLVDLFANLEKTKAYAAEIKAGLETLSETTRAQAAESRRLVDLAVEVEAQRQINEQASARLTASQLAHAADVAAFKAHEDTARKELAADRQALVTRATALDQKQENLQRQEAEIVVADKKSQDSADRRTAELDARETALKAREDDINVRWAKLKDLAG
jgi:hypothetical protein